MATFKLIPFPADRIPNIHIAIDVKRIENQLSIFYSTQGDIDEILLPKLSAPVARQDNLWQATCFEFFIAIPNQPAYWEFNLSPSGDWNAYAMDAYRQVNMRQETAFTQLPFEFQKFDAKGPMDIYMYALETSVNLSSILQASQKIQLGISAVIQTKDGNESYWALSHPGEQADFHLRESFTILL